MKIEQSKVENVGRGVGDNFKYGGWYRAPLKRTFESRLEGSEGAIQVYLCVWRGVFLARATARAKALRWSLPGLLGWRKGTENVRARGQGGYWARSPGLIGHRKNFDLSTRMT